MQYTGSLIGLSWLNDSDKTLCERLNLTPGDNLNYPSSPQAFNFPTTPDEQLTWLGRYMQVTQYANVTNETLDVPVSQFLFACKQKNSRTRKFAKTYMVLNLVDYLEEMLDSKTQCHKTSKEYNAKLLGLKYTHTENGPSRFFEDIDDCHNHITQLNINVPNYEDLIDLALSAFEASALITRELKEISTEWDQELTTKAWTDNTMWTKFKNFYVKKLITNKKKNLATNHDILQSNMVTLNKKIKSKFNEIRNNQQQFKASVPAMINTDATTMDTTLGTNVSQRDFNDFQAEMQRSMLNIIASVVANALKKTNYNAGGGGTPGNNNYGRHTTRGTWRQYNDWC